jgi:glutamate dehydrogenase (NAD(P)+)
MNTLVTRGLRKFGTKTFMIKEQQQFMHTATEHVNERFDILQKMIDCEFMYKFRLSYNKDSGERGSCIAYRAIHGKEYKPSCGGIVLDPTIEMQEIEAMAGINKFRNALMGIPFSGSMGGIAINPSMHSEKEIYSMMQSYARELNEREYIGAYKDVISIDSHTKDSTRQAIIDSFLLYHQKEKQKYACVLGKPLEHKGIAGSQVNEDLGILNVINYILGNIDLCKSYNIYPGLKNRRVFVCV